MRKLLVFGLILAATSALGQSFEVMGWQENYKGLIGETIKAPIRFKNISDKPITLIVKRQHTQIGGTQKNYFCIDNNCLDQKVEEYVIRLEPDQSINSIQIALEAGLAQGHSAVKYNVTNRSNPADNMEFEINFQVDEKSEKAHIYTSRFITLYDIYPNPVSVEAIVDYKVHDDIAKSKIVLHNILGNAIEEYPLPAIEEQVKIRAESLNPGIYFYTLYIDNEGVVTRKLIIKK